MIFDIDECEEKLGYRFRDKMLLRRSFTHVSYANEHGVNSNENLEYLGDSIVNFIVAEHLYTNYPECDEGELTKKRAELVSAKPLSEVMAGMEAGKMMLFGAGELKTGAENRNILADLFEAVLGAIYLDGGMKEAKRFVTEKLLSQKQKRVKAAAAPDVKSVFQEYVQKRGLGKIEYRESYRKGPDHAPIFGCDLYLGGKYLCSGEGGSKKESEKDAASTAYNKLSLYKSGTEAAREDKESKELKIKVRNSEGKTFGKKIKRREREFELQ